MGDLVRKRIMVTSGGTREYIDDVRVITNISSGALGAKIAEELLERGASVSYVHAKRACIPINYDTLEGWDTSRNLLCCHEIVTSYDLFETMKKLLTGFNIDAVVHAAAVSDFTFDLNKAMKLSSSSPEAFIEHLRSTIKKTPKIIRHIHEWDPKTILIGFKFTVGCKDILPNARDFLKSTGSHMIVANDKEEMAKLRIHRAYLVTNIGHVTANGKVSIAVEIADFLENIL